MILVDTSVLIDYLKDIENLASKKFQDLLNSKIKYGITPFTYQELLQGANTDKEFNTLKAYFETQTFYHLANNKKSFENAAKIYYKCRKKGITISSIIDFLIVQTAIDNKLLLLHNDKDFIKISKVINIKFW